MAEEGSIFLYYAYGVHIDRRHMAALHPDCEWMGLARADGVRLGFDDQGHANLYYQSDSRAWGVLWMVPAAAMVALDAWAAERGQRREAMMIVSPAGPRVPATTYRDRKASEGDADAEEFAVILKAMMQEKVDRGHLATLQPWRK